MTYPMPDMMGYGHGGGYGYMPQYPPVPFGGDPMFSGYGGFGGFGGGYGGGPAMFGQMHQLQGAFYRDEIQDNYQIATLQAQLERKSNVGSFILDGLFSGNPWEERAVLQAQNQALMGSMGFGYF